jgi:hypothetical protein
MKLLNLEDYKKIRQLCFDDVELQDIISRLAPDWTVCPNCGCDDFTHAEGCEVENAPMAEEN